MKNLFPVRALFLFTLLVLGLTACQKESLSPTVNEVPTDVVGDRNNTIVDIAIGNPDFSALVAAVVKTNQVALFSAAGLNATVLAPNNAAFAALPAPFNTADNINGIQDAATIDALRQILRYHVVKGAKTAAQFPNGNYQTLKNAKTTTDNIITIGRSAEGNVFVNGNTKVIAADIVASNGVIHVIDKVLLPPGKDIGQVAIGNGGFTALVAALKKAGLANITFQAGNWTVFAPTDAAFAKLPAPLNNAANISAITDPATINLLKSVLLYHLVPARVFSVDLREGASAPTALANSNLKISLANGAQVSGTGNSTPANIVAVNILATNGVIHVIDTVLLP